MPKQPQRFLLEQLEARRTLDAGRFAVLSNAIGPTAADHYDQVVAGDFNGDGRDDLFMIVHSTGENRLVFARANRAFSVVTNRLGKTSVDGYTQVVVGDFNGDGRDDLFFLARDSGSNRFAFGNSSEGFSMATNLISPRNIDDYSHWGAGDLDRNGRDDLFLVDRTTGANRSVFALANQQFSVKSDAISRSTADGYSHIVVDDFDNDGRDDVFFWNSASGSNRLAYARSGQKFSAASNLISPGMLAGYQEVVAFDFDGTDRADLFFLNRTTGNNLLAKMATNQQFEVATNRLKTTSASGFTQLVGGNFDGDSRDDLYFVNSTSGSNRFAYSRKSFDIEIVFEDKYSQQQQAMIRAAAARWSQIIVGDLPEVRDVDSNDEHYDRIDDLVVEVTTADIEGDNTLADTQILVARGSDLPALARIRVDLDHLDSLASGNDLTGVMIHEMGHALGMEEQTWLNLGLLEDSTDPHPVFVGNNARREFQAVFGMVNGENVAVENVGGSGSRNHHWRENVMGNEIMTSQYSLGVLNPISRITVGALDDMGYTVDYAAADSYSG